MGALSGIPGFSPMQQRMLEDAIRQQEIYEQIERAMGGRAVLDFIESNREAIKLVESHSVEEQRVIEAARDLASGVTARREALKLATEIQQQHGLIADGSALELARKLSGVDALQDEIRRAAEEHQSLAQRLAREASGYTEMVSMVRQSADIEHTFMAAIRNHPALSVGKALEAAMAIESPWVLVADPYRSFSGFAALSEIGQAMAGLTSDYAEAAARLSTLVGDWTPPAGFAYWDQAQRLEAFMKSGIDGSFFEIPTQAFEEVAEASGIVVPAPAVAPTGSAKPKEPQVVIVVGSSIHLAAHDHVRSSEILIRQRVSWSMAAVHGRNWPKHVIHGNVLAELRERRAAPTQLTPSPSILDYATFGELLSIVMRKDVWAAAFDNFPMTPEEFRVCVGRLVEVRNAVDHGRELDPMEYVWAFAEATRLQRALGAQPPPVTFEQ